MSSSAQPAGSRSVPLSSARAASAARSRSSRFSVRAASRAASSVRVPAEDPPSRPRTGFSGATVVLAIPATLLRSVVTVTAARRGLPTRSRGPAPAASSAVEQLVSDPARDRQDEAADDRGAEAVDGETVAQEGGEPEQGGVDDQQEQPEGEQHERQGEQPQDRADDGVDDAEDQRDPQVGAELAERTVGVGLDPESGQHVGMGELHVPLGERQEDRREDHDLERELDHLATLAAANSRRWDLPSASGV